MSGRPSRTLAETLAGWASAMTLRDVPDRVVVFARSQLLSQLGSIRAGLRHPVGTKIVNAFGAPSQADPKRSAYVLSALSIALDFDDTAYAGHLSHSTVNVPLAYAADLALDGADLVTAMISANEFAGRITAAATLGPLRGQTATHAHLAGAVAARLKCARAPATQWVHALGLALSLPPMPISRAFFASDAKLLAASVPVQAGLDACDAAAAGFIGAADLLEHRDGFLARFAEVPLPAAVIAGLGTRWHSETFSFKVYPGSAYTSSAIDCAVALHRQLRDIDPDAISEVVVEGSLFTVLLERGTENFVHGADSTLPALNFSLGYNMATALLTGGLKPEDLAEPAMSEKRRWRLADRVSVKHDPEFTQRALAGTAPLGEALLQAGPLAADWLRPQGGDVVAKWFADPPPPATSFQSATKQLGARVTVRLHDGREFSHGRKLADGAIGWGNGAARWGVVRDKFLGTGGAADVAEAIGRVETLSHPELLEVLRLAISC